MMLTREQVGYVKRFLIDYPRDGSETLRLNIAKLFDTINELRAELEAVTSERDELQRANNPYCLLCGRTEPCMTEVDLKPEDPGIPCTFEYTPLKMFEVARQYKQQLAQSQARVLELEGKYNELIMQVGNKFDGESRHDTAKRYLRQHEHCGEGGPAKAALTPTPDAEYLKPKE